MTVTMSEYSSAVHQIGQIANLLGLFLALLALFTSEQARRLGEEKRRTGNPDQANCRTIVGLSAALGTVTLAGVVSMAPLMWRCVATFEMGRRVDPVLTVFVLVWSLLIALVVWQFRLAKGAWPHS